MVAVGVYVKFSPGVEHGKHYIARLEALEREPAGEPFV